MKKTSSSLLFIVFLFVTFLNAGAELDYLNSLRTKAGMPIFTQETHLTAAAQNHSAYMQLNNLSGHYEDSTKNGYTGKYGADRSVYAGYLSRNVSENVSSGSENFTKSIDGLMSAIYHRFGFLSLERDEIGIGVSNDAIFYTYDMANSVLRNLCQNGTYSGGSYYLPCADTSKQIDATDYETISNSIKNASPDLILWPAENISDIPPVFYEEVPDPLPNHGVSGYPVSVEFNRGKFTTAPSVSSFTLEDTSGVRVNSIINMDKTNDPNGDFTEYQFALFPEKRLAWGISYNVELIYTYNGTQSVKNWCFETRTLEGKVDRFYSITNNTDISLDIISSKSYAVYVIPNNTKDILGGASYSATANVSGFSFIDNNTFTITVTGDIGTYVDLSFTNGQKLKLTIANTDTASIPKHVTCAQSTDTDGDGIMNSEDLDDDNDGYSDLDEIKAGSNPLDNRDMPLDTDKDGIPNAFDTDDDNDGISDIDEILHGLNPLNASDAEADFDNDGFSNAIEISVGSDIRIVISKPKWVPVMMGETIISIPYFQK